MATKSGSFNKKIFAMLIDKAKGERSVRRFASECGISYLQMRKLLMCEQENPPRIKLITKLAENSENGVELEDYLYAAGKVENADTNTVELTQKEKHFLENYNSLSVKQQKTVEDFIDFLLRYKGKKDNM
ncbi:MAG: hypothetical protein IKU43_08785 [Clostridia bacterium]|nr:hypothetical protein [Clostridia bacterium]